MSKLNLKISILLLLIACSNSSAQQIFQLYQAVDVEKYQGKDFILEGKIFYEQPVAIGSFAVLFGMSIDEKGKPMGNPKYNDDAGVYYKNAEWSPYELKGKIDKKAKYLAVGVAIAGNENYNLDEFKLYVKEGKTKIEIPLQNTGFENPQLTNWLPDNKNKDTELLVSTSKAFSGTQSLYIDNSKVKVAPTLGNNAEVGKYMDVNGVKLYYEIYGEGEPLLLIHGNNSSMAAFHEQFDALSKKYKIIGLDSRGQGKSSPDDTPLTYELMAEDVNVFLDKLNLKNVNVLGWSDGGNIGVILAIQHPDKVKKMAIMGTVLYNDETSVFNKINNQIHQQVKEMENRGITKDNMDYRLKILLLNEPHVNPDALQSIKAPTLVMAGEHDVVKEKHTKLIADKIPNSKLIIFKGADHEAPSKIPELFNQTVLAFFE